LFLITAKQKSKRDSNIFLSDNQLTKIFFSSTFIPAYYYVNFMPKNFLVSADHKKNHQKYFPVVLFTN